MKRNRPKKALKLSLSHSLHLHAVLVPVLNMGHPQQLVVPDRTSGTLDGAQIHIGQDQRTRRHCYLVLTFDVKSINVLI